MPYKVRPRNPANKNANFLAIGNAIIAAWGSANESVDNIDVEDLRREILSQLDPSGGNTGRRVDVGLIFDENLDRQTRFVWLAIPTPDVKRRNGIDDSWERYINETFATDAAVEELGESILFGCGR